MSRSKTRKRRHTKIRAYKDKLTLEFCCSEDQELHGCHFSLQQFPKEYFDRLKKEYLRSGIYIYNVEHYMDGIYFSMKPNARRDSR